MNTRMKEAAMSKGSSESSILCIEQRVSALDTKVDRLQDGFVRIEAIIGELKDSVTFLGGQIDDFKSKLKEAISDITEAKKGVASIRSDQIALRNEVSQIRKDYFDMHSKLHRDALEITGIPEKSGESLINRVLACADKAKVPLVPTDIKSAYRQNKTGQKNGNILVTFASLEKREAYVTQCRKTKLIGEDVGVIGSATKIFLNDVLSPAARRLLYMAKQFRSEQKWKFVWTKNGTVFLKKQEGDQAIPVTCEHDLLSLGK